MDNSFVQRFAANIQLQSLFTLSDTLLVGVSGGRDSVVLTDLLFRAGYTFALAHCNFNLRGEESDQDEIFVRNLAEKYGKPFYTKSFDTLGYASSEGISVEMAARDLRYSWFEEIRQLIDFDWILVAHHLDDQAETFFLNLARGTGIAGLTGMKPVNGKIVRPLLFASGTEIENYAADNSLPYRDDSSNAVTDFQRNKIRHLVIPLMQELNPAFREGLQQTISHLKDTSLIYNQAIEMVRLQVMRSNSAGETEISLSGLRTLHPLQAYLFELLKPFHFNGDVVGEIVNSLDKQPGKQFFSPTHRAVIDREAILLSPLEEVLSGRFYIEESCRELAVPTGLKFSSYSRGASLSISSSNGISIIDKDKLQFPLILRRWQKGDYFQPLGMQQMKKLSDFFIDQKLSIPEKENVWILANGEEIVWIVGIRLDDRYKVTAATKNLFEAKLV